MDKFIAKLLRDFEDKKLSRRQLVHTIKVAAATYAAGESAAHAAPANNSFKTIAVNHISYRCPDYTIARDFYQHLMGMGVVQDSGRQCMMPFGQAGSHLLPRGYPTAPQNYTSSGTVSVPAAPRGQGGAAADAGARGNAGARGAAAGNRGGTGNANAANASARGNAQQPQSQARIDHIAFTCKNWDKARVKSILESWGLYPTEDGDSYHVRDPFGFNLQISGPGMTGFPDTNQRNSGGAR
jgi:catechol 2,3-dioxygenase-like lactoylglutathione lyase family enzyme